MSEPLLVESQPGWLRLVINRPEQRNALSLTVLDLLASTLRVLAGRDDLHCVVLTASGDRCFAAGGDLKELDAVRSPSDTMAMSRRGRAALDAIRDFPVPVVAALNGHALGGGAELAMACDLRVAAGHAELGFLQGQLGVTTAWGGGIDLLAEVGPARGLALLAEAGRISARDAEALGLFHEVARQEEALASCVARFIAPLLARPVQVLRANKALARAVRRLLHTELTALEEAGFVATWTHADHWSAAERALKPREA